MEDIQDEVRGENGGQRDWRVPAAILAIPALTAMVIVGFLLLRGSDDDADGSTGDVTSSESAEGSDDVAFVDGADITISLAEGFVIDGDGEVIPEVDELVAEIVAMNGVENAIYVGPSTIQGIAPDAPTLTSDGHQILVELNDPSMSIVIADTYEDHPIVLSVGFDS